MSDELKQLLDSKPNLTESTRKQYISHYKKIIDALDTQIRLSSPNAIIKAFEQVYNTASNKWVGINIPILIYQNNNLPLGKLATYRDLIQQQKHEHLMARNKDKNITLPSMIDLNRHLKSLMDADEYRKYVLNYLLITFGVRNEDVDVFITNNRNELLNRERNYLFVFKNKIQWIRNKYKTFKNYGTKTINITAKQFISAVNELPLDEWLLVDSNGDHIVPSSVGRYIQDRTYNEIGEGDIFKIIIKDITNKGKNVLTKLSQLSDWRGTDLKTIAQFYDIDLETL